MSTITQNPFNATAFEVPEPPEEFGQDGGKFYRAYDALAEEVDDDMAASLKEQLDGMLVFVRWNCLSYPITSLHDSPFGR